MLNNAFSFLFGSSPSQTPAGGSPMANKLGQTNPFGLTTASGPKMLFAGGLPTGNDNSHGDQLDAFRSQIALGMINPNLRQPALPYTATQGWNA